MDWPESPVFPHLDRLLYSIYVGMYVYTRYIQARIIIIIILKRKCLPHSRIVGRTPTTTLKSLINEEA